MENKLKKIQELAIPIPITSTFRQKAETFAMQYFTANIRKKVYQNTLALLAANTYFQLLNFQTNITTVERWDARIRLWSEATEIELVGLGKLECFLISMEQSFIRFPPEAWCDRIGYLFIELSSSEREAKLIGILPACSLEISQEGILIEDLLSMDEAIDYFADLADSCLGKRDEIENPAFDSADQAIISLKNWLNHLYEEGWEPVMRNLSAATGKKIFQLAGHTIELRIFVSQSNNKLILVRVDVQSQGALLPRGMIVSVPDESEIYAKTVNEQVDLITIPLEFHSGESFWVELRLDEFCIREYFTV